MRLPIKTAIGKRRDPKRFLAALRAFRLEPLADALLDSHAGGPAAHSLGGRNRRGIAEIFPRARDVKIVRRRELSGQETSHSRLAPLAEDVIDSFLRSTN